MKRWLEHSNRHARPAVEPVATGTVLVAPDSQLGRRWDAERNIVTVIGTRTKAGHPTQGPPWSFSISTPTPSQGPHAPPVTRFHISVYPNE